MRILSKYKDYYDYLTGIYGVDPLIILDRRDFEIPEFFSNEIKKIDLYIGGMEVEGLYHKGDFYFGKNIAQFDTTPSDINGNKWYRRWYNKDKHNEKTLCYSIDDGIPRSTRISIYPDPIKSDINEKYGCPILMRKPYIYKSVSQPESIENFYKFPKLSDMNVQSILAPEKVWLMLTDFLTKKDIVVDNRTNTEKILTAGFDLKESFRGKNK